MNHEPCVHLLVTIRIIIIPTKARWKALLWRKKQKNNEMFRNLETNCYLCTEEIKRKCQKTPKKEIAKAERIRQEYFNARK